MKKTHMVMLQRNRIGDIINDMNTTNKTTAALAPITKADYARLVKNLRHIEDRAQFNDDAKGLAAAFKSRVEAYCIDCPGHAHSAEAGGMVDNCMICAPRWGRILNPALTK